MAAAWEYFGEIANVAQLTGLDAVRLIGLIVQAAGTARMHKNNCKHFANHLKLIGNLLKQLDMTELTKRPETREPLDQLEDALRRSYVLVNSCRDRSYLYLLAMGWTVVYQFKKAQAEIDRYLNIIPLITLVNNARIRERLEYIEMDQHEYTFDDEDKKMREVILNPDPMNTDYAVLNKTLSGCYHPYSPFDQVFMNESENLHLESHSPQSSLHVMGQCETIQHLMEIAEIFSSKPQDSPKQVYKMMVPHKEEYQDNNNNPNKNAHTNSRSTSASSRQDLLPTSTRSHQKEEWHSHLLGCCSEPVMCIKTFVFPCGALSKIATVATNRHITSAEAWNKVMAYSLILSCCCYTCCIRRKLRKALNITGGCCVDFLSHFMCCCCALVQELREVERLKFHGASYAQGPETTKTRPPTSQHMEA